MKTGLRIGQLGAAVGMPAKTIRYYEQIGLVPKAQRNSAGYRVYSEAEVARLRFISRAKLLGLSLKDIKVIASYVADGHCAAAQSRVATLVGEKIDEIEAKIAELTALKADLRQYRIVLVGRGQESAKVAAKKRMDDCSCLAGLTTTPRGRA